MRNLRVSAIGLVAVIVLTLFLLRFLRTPSAQARPAGDVTARTPVLVELFTSEGCSDCPPADRLLEKLDRTQPVGNADLIVLSEHVDYWDDIGWKDPYSSHQYSERQDAYAKQLHLDTVYTPQMVVDGSTEFVGSNERRAIGAIQNAAKQEKIPVGLSSVHLEENHNVVAHVEVGALGAGSGSKSARVLIALADDSDQSSVRAGENAGRLLRHVAVLRSLTQVGTVDMSGPFAKDVRVSATNANPRNLRVVAIVQEMAAGKILGLGSTQLSN